MSNLTPDVVEQFHFRVNDIFTKIENNVGEITASTRQRDELLPLLMNGQVVLD